jgi:hypothetical protein
MGKKQVNRTSSKKNTNSSSDRIRIHNPVTNSYYQVRRRTTSAGKKGTIIGKWSNKAAKKNK